QMWAASSSGVSLGAPSSDRPPIIRPTSCPQKSARQADRAKPRPGLALTELVVKKLKTTCSVLTTSLRLESYFFASSIRTKNPPRVTAPLSHDDTTTTVGCGFELLLRPSSL